MDEAANEVQSESRIKKSVERSAAYAAFSIEESIPYVSEIYKNFRTAFTKRDDIAAVVENSHPRNMAACVYYLFLNRDKDSYQVSEIYRTIANPLSDLERRKCLLQAFAAPKLNSELIEKFDGNTVPPELVIHLYRFHKITEDAAPLAAEIFLKNARFCGVMGGDNILRYKQTLDSLNSGSVSQPTVAPISPSITPDSAQQGTVVPPNPTTPPPPPNQGAPLLLEEMVNEEKVKIRLTGNKIAYLIYPNSITKTDVKILQKQIEQLDLIIE